MTKPKTHSERLIVIETKIDELKEAINNINENLVNLDNKYSGKWVEKITIGMLLGLIGLIFKIIIG